MKKTTLTLSALALSLGMAFAPLATNAAETVSSSTQQLPSLAPMLQKIMPSVVSISVEGTAAVKTNANSQFQQFFGDMTPFCQQGSPFMNSPLCQVPDAGRSQQENSDHLALV